MRRTPRFLALAAAATLVLSACGGSSDSDGVGGITEDGDITVIKVGASPVPHADILNFINDNLAADAGIRIDVIEYDDYVEPNRALAEDELAANYFQHEPYLNAQIADHGYSFTSLTGVHIEPLGAYSERITDLADLPDGAEIGITDDPSNQARGLYLLEDAGIITLADTGDEAPTVLDVAENPKNIRFHEAEAAQLPRSLQDVDLALINGNYALDAGLVPVEDALRLETVTDNPYANLLVVRSADADNAALRTLADLLTSDEVRAFITETWPNGELIAAF